jgi:hypothetical protein
VLRRLFTLLTTPVEQGEARATDYPTCPMCDGKTWIPRSRGEAVIKYTDMWIRQYFDCEGCGMRCRLQRPVDSKMWGFSNIYRGW